MRIWHILFAAVHVLNSLLAVMDFTRSPRTVLPREGESPIERKIRQLEEASECQSWRVRHLLHQTSSSSHRPPTRPQNPFPHTPSYQLYSETPKERYVYQDFLNEMKMLEEQGSYRAPLKKIQRQPLPLLDGMEGFENRQLDQQMQYFKSEEYRKRLEVLAMENSYKHAHPKHNHQVYVKASTRLPCKPYQMLRSTTGINAPSRSPRRQAVSPQNRRWKAQEMFPQASYRLSMREDQKIQRYEPKYEQPCRMDPPQQKPILTPRNMLQQRQANRDWQLDAVALGKGQSSEGSLHKQIKEKPAKSSTKLVEHKRSYSPSFQPIKTQHTVSIHQTRIETYRKQLQFCNRKQQKTPKPANKNKPKKSYKYADVKIGSNKQNKVQQSRLSSPSSSPSKNPYDLCYRIDRNPSKPPPYDYKPRPKQVTSYIQSTQAYQPARKKTPKHTQLITETSISYRERPLQDSQTNSTATRTDKQANKWRKISVVSRSKLK